VIVLCSFSHPHPHSTRHPFTFTLSPSLFLFFASSELEGTSSLPPPAAAEQSTHKHHVQIAGFIIASASRWIIWLVLTHFSVQQSTWTSGQVQDHKDDFHSLRRFLCTFHDKAHAGVSVQARDHHLSALRAGEDL